MSLLLGHDEVVGKWVGSIVGAEFFPPWRAIGITTEEGFLSGGFVCHDWNGSNLEMTIALGRPLTRPDLRGIAHYVFVQLGARRITLRTRTDNRPAVLFLRRHALFEALLKNWFPEGDAMQFVIHADDPRWARWRSQA